MTVHIKLSQGPGIFNSRTNSGGAGSERGYGKFK